MKGNPPIACSLSADELSTRMESARELGAQALIGVDAADRRAVLRFHGHRAAVEALVEAERRCCAFLELDVRQRGEGVELEIVTPEGGESVMRGLVAGVVAGWDEALR